MKFDKLSPRIQKLIYDLASDSQFQEVFRSDPELDRIDQLKKRKQDRYKIAQALLTGRIRLHGRAWKAPTMAAVMFLNAVQSPLMPGGSGEVSEADLDLFLWATQEQDPDFSGEWAFESNGYSKAFGPFEPADISEILRLSFDPFRMLPSAGDQSPLDFDPQWACAILSRASLASGMPADELMKMPLVKAAAYFVEWIKLNSTKRLHDHSDVDLLRAEDDRCCQLICDFLESKGRLTKAQAAAALELMKLPVKER